MKDLKYYDKLDEQEYGKLKQSMAPVNANIRKEEDIDVSGYNWKESSDSPQRAKVAL